MKSVIILGSSRSDGDAKRIAVELIQRTHSDLIDLNDYTIGYFDYEHQNKDDDFLKLIEQIIQDYDTFIFATPVYWYAMSGIMKVFFDRLTDLITVEKNLGRQLRGKEMAVITSSNGGNLGENFWWPFKESANYLGMKYLGNLHTISDEDYSNKLDQFATLFKH